MLEVKDSKHNTCARGDLAKKYEGYKDTNSVILLYNNHFNKYIYRSICLILFILQLRWVYIVTVRKKNSLKEIKIVVIPF